MSQPPDTTTDDRDRDPAASPPLPADREADVSAARPRGGKRALRGLGLVAVTWVGVFLVVQVVIMLAGVAARAAGKDPRLHDEGDWPPIVNLRLVDDTLLVGGQPTADDYRALADQGVTLVVDMRSGTDTGADRDDEALLASLGMRYASVPIHDGRAPTPAQSRRFIDLVDSADGLVFAHCGGGVGRSTTIAASYQAAHGQDPSVAAQLATGPPTIEQIWYVATIDPGHPEHNTNSGVALVSRLVDMPRTVFNRIVP